MNSQAVKRPYAIKENINQAFSWLRNRPELDLVEYRCTAVGRWLEFKVMLHGDHSFLMYFGSTRKVLNHCRRMCRNGRRYVQGITINFTDTVEEIGRKIANCILAVRQALSSGNRVVTEHSEPVFQPNLQAPAVWERPILRAGFSFA